MMLMTLMIMIMLIIIIQSSNKYVCVQRATAAAGRTSATLTRRCLRGQVTVVTVPTVVTTRSAFTASSVASRSTRTRRPATASTVRVTQKVDLPAVSAVTEMIYQE